MSDSETHQRKDEPRGEDKQQEGQRDQRSQGIARDERGQDQPVDKDRAQRTSALKSQKDAAESQQESPGQPAGGE